ncbi:succinylglutamate desuccinylase [Roseivirga seohaensis subsp. aquiponti]|uniref:Succinylglutamate desuccinylase n=1 Tax=Roseivirga seohaensis subsp. aquiponti TaxID=1566026 RepID=A0A0L8ANV7_9BACT|nr:succinylglutamate desuccinylase/aspartoacylase family protein [Roseivirga seohaensis]KOF03862.1 succinylglutamate desuccinylase [Roseivirga seohaensis subsp. aquiponti]
MKTPLVIGGKQILPGQETKININIARLPSHSPIDLHITVARSEIDGPTLLLSGGMHGDEINGTEIVRRIIEKDQHIPRVGTVICIPIINMFGFIHFSRYVPDGKDVNRSFPGNKNGSLAARVAHYLTTDIIPKIDMGLDFHTGGADRTNYPQIRCALKEPKNQKIAEIFQPSFILNSPFRPKSMRQTAAKMGKQILVYEGGESARFDEFAIQQGINGALRVMKHLGMRERAPEAPHVTKTINNSSWIRAKTSGVFLTMVPYGSEVEKNQLIGHISDPFGGSKIKIKSPVSGYVIGLNNNPIVHQGDALMHIGVRK